MTDWLFIGVMSCTFPFFMSRGMTVMWKIMCSYMEIRVNWCLMTWQCKHVTGGHVGGDTKTSCSPISVPPLTGVESESFLVLSAEIRYNVTDSSCFTVLKDNNSDSCWWLSIVGVGCMDIFVYILHICGRVYLSWLGFPLQMLEQVTLHLSPY